MLRMACFSTSRIKLFVFIAALFLSAELRNNFLTQATRTSFTNTVLCIAMLIKDYCVFKNIVLLFDLSAVSEKESFVSSIFHQGLFFLLCYRSFLLRIYDFSLSYSNDFPLSF